MNVSQYVSNSVNSHSNNMPKTASEKTQEKSTTAATDNVDKFDNSSVNVNKNYQSAAEGAEKSDIQTYYKGMSAFQMKNAAMSDYVSNALKGQAGKSFWSNMLNSTFTPQSFALDAFNAAEATSEKYDDYWGVEATAERIFTFAKSLAGDNDEMFDKMKNAFLKGFSQALGAAGGKLPDISNQTKSRVLELFDQWETEIKAKKNPAPVEK